MCTKSIKISSLNDMRSIQSSSVPLYYEVHISMENLWVHSSDTTEIEYRVGL